METFTDALLLKDTATRPKVAIVYGLLGLALGTFVFASRT